MFLSGMICRLILIKTIDLILRMFLGSFQTLFVMVVPVDTFIPSHRPHDQQTTSLLRSRLPLTLRKFFFVVRVHFFRDVENMNRKQTNQLVPEPWYHRDKK